MISFRNSFDVAPASDFATISFQSGGSMTATYNDTAKAVDLTAGNYGSAWVITSWPLLGATGVDDLLFEADLELALDPSGRKHLGVWLVQRSPFIYGYRLVHLDGSWYFSRWDGWAGERAISAVKPSNPAFDLGTRHKLRVIKRGESFHLYVDDALVLVATDGTYPNVGPGVFAYGCTARVHELVYQAQDLGTSTVALHSGGIMWANEEPIAQAWPGENEARALHKSKGVRELWRTLTPSLLTGGWATRSDLGYIEGYVTVKKAKAAGRVVFAFVEGMVLVDSAVTDADGYYRMDNLPLGLHLTLLVTDNWGFDYSPVGASKVTPTPYGD